MIADPLIRNELLRELKNIILQYFEEAIPPVAMATVGFDVTVLQFNTQHYN